MKNVLNVFYRTVLAFIVCDISITLWFVFAYYSAVPHITFKSVLYIFIHYGSALSIPGTIAFLIIYALYKKVKKRWVVYLSALIILYGAFLCTNWIFIWYMIAGLFTNDLFTQ